MRPEDADAQRDYASALASLGARHAHASRFADAARCFERALNVTPADAGLYRRLANARNDQGRDGRALAALEAAVRISPADAAISSEVKAARLRRAVGRAGGWSRDVERKVVRAGEVGHEGGGPDGRVS